MGYSASVSDAVIRCEHHLLVGRPDTAPGDAELLLIRGPLGWALPRLESKDQRAADVGEINRAARALLGAEVSVLRCLADTSGDGVRRQIHDLDSHTAGWTLPPGSRWIVHRDLGAIRLESPEQRRILGEWFRSRSAPVPALDGRDWIRPGWRHRVLGWVDGELSRRGLGPVREVEQVRLWEFSQVLRLRTAEAELYVKALPLPGDTELGLTEYLARLFPTCMPVVIAAEPRERWLLMRATVGPALMDISDLSRWEQATAAYARVQIDCVDRVEELAALGCPRRSIEWLEAEIDPLLDDTAALQPEDPEALSDAEMDRVRALGPEIHAMARELEAGGLPLSIEHGDLWAANVIAGERDCVLIDWEDACLGPPFFSVFLLCASLDYTEALSEPSVARRRLREAYLGPWRQRLGGWRADRVERVFDLSQQLAAVHYAVQFRRSTLQRIETSREVRGFIPLFLRRLLRTRAASE
jgi:hypothetical protein